MKCPALGLLLAFAACAIPEQPGGLPSTRTLATVSASEAALAAAGRVVLACYNVPACAKAAPKPVIKSAYDDAYAAVTTAQQVADVGGTPDMTATAATLAVLQALVAQLPPT